MIQVTLSFPSIASAVAALALMDPATAGTAKLTGTPGNAQTAAAAQTSSTADTARSQDSAAQTASTKKPSASPEKPAGKVEEPKPEPTKPAADTPLDYVADVRPLVLKVGALPDGREKLTALLAKFGVAKGPELSADKLPAFKGELDTLLAA